MLLAAEKPSGRLVHSARAFIGEQASDGVVLHLGHARSFNHCALSPVQGPGIPAEDMADLLADVFADDPANRDVEPPQRVDLPAGPAYLIRMSVHADVVDAPVSIYLLGGPESVFTAVCSTTGARPDDDWLSIAETIEFLPAEE